MPLIGNRMLEVWGGGAQGRSDSGKSSEWVSSYFFAISTMTTIGTAHSIHFNKNPYSVDRKPHSLEQ